MHALHKILVHVPDACDTGSGISREEMISSIRSLAESRTEEFADRVFDWREVDTAGGWGATYSENVLLGAEDGNLLLAELAEVREYQGREIEEDLEQFKSIAGNSLTAAVNMLWDATATEVVPGFNMGAFYLNKMAKLLYGEYDFDSMFYDTNDYTAKVDSGTLEKVKKSPHDWALVMFDYHN